MRTLAIECATDACSVALFDADGTLLIADHRVLGRGHAEHLVPMIAALPDKGRAERILVSRGPGSFTGVRIGLAVAGALGVAWQAKVLGYPTLSLVGAMALHRSSDDAVTVCMTGGHGEWFVQDFGPGGSPLSELLSLTPDAARRRGAAYRIVGSRADEFRSLLGEEHRAELILPDAQSTPLLAGLLVTDDVAPLYGRGPDARLPA